MEEYGENVRPGRELVSVRPCGGLSLKGRGDLRLPHGDLGTGIGSLLHPICYRSLGVLELESVEFLHNELSALAKSPIFAQKGKPSSSSISFVLSFNSPANIYTSLSGT